MTRTAAIPLVLLMASAAAGVAGAQGLVFTGTAELVHPGLVSTAASEVKITFSPDGTRMLWGTGGRTGGPGSLDIWESSQEKGVWSKPKPVSFNSPEEDFDPFFAPNGRGVYFFSNRPGGIGKNDVWFVPFDAKTGRFGTAVNLGAAVNSSGDEWAPILTKDGTHLIFASDGRGGQGLHDLFISEQRDGAWLPATPLPGNVNSPDEEFDAVLLDGDTVLIFTRKGKDQDGADLFISALKNGAWGEPARLGPEVNAPGAWNFGPARHPREPGVLYFTSHREGNTRGRSDIYRIRCRHER
jgi:TolB protein